MLNVCSFTIYKICGFSPGFVVWTDRLGCWELFLCWFRVVKISSTLRYYFSTTFPVSFCTSSLTWYRISSFAFVCDVWAVLWRNKLFEKKPRCFLSFKHIAVEFTEVIKIRVFNENDFLTDQKNCCSGKGDFLFYSLPYSDISAFQWWTIIIFDKHWLFFT